MPVTSTPFNPVMKFLSEQYTALSTAVCEASKSGTRAEIELTKEAFIGVNKLIKSLQGKSPAEMKSILDENRFSLHSTSILCHAIINVKQMLGEEPNKMDVLHEEILKFLEDTKLRFEKQEGEPGKKHQDGLRDIVGRLKALPVDERVSYLQALYNEKSMFSTMRNEVISVLLEKYQKYDPAATETITHNPLSGGSVSNRHRFHKKHDIENDVFRDNTLTPKN